MHFFCSIAMLYNIMFVHLQCVFHGIRFKVNKIGCRETINFFYTYLCLSKEYQEMRLKIRFFIMK